jgi:glucosylceramidase
MNKQLNMETLFNICILFFLQTFQVVFAQNIKWISTTEQNRWVTNEPLRMKPANSALAIEIEILPNQKHQSIEGWGSCFNELGWDAIQPGLLLNRP